MIQVKNLSKEFKLSKQKRKEMGDEFKDVKIFKAVDNISFECSPGKIFGLIGIGYYVSLTIGTILVMIGVMICFEIVRRATFARVFYGIKGGKSEVEKLYPFNKIERNDLKVLLKIIFHGLAIAMTIGLLVLLIGAGIVNEI